MFNGPWYIPNIQNLRWQEEMNSSFLCRNRMFIHESTIDEKRILFPLGNQPMVFSQFLPLDSQESAIEGVSISWIWCFSSVISSLTSCTGKRTVPDILNTVKEVRFKWQDFTDVSMQVFSFNEKIMLNMKMNAPERFAGSDCISANWSLVIYSWSITS